MISCISSVVLWPRRLIALFVQVPVELYMYVCNDHDDICVYVYLYRGLSALVYGLLMVHDDVFVGGRHLCAFPPFFSL